MHEASLSKLVRIALLPAFAVGITVSAQAQTSPAKDGNASAKAAQTKPDSTAYRALRASKMIGMPVRNPEGKNVGKISDLIVNMNTGDVRYAILEFDPGIFTAEKLFAVPTTQLRMAADRDDLVYNMTRDKLERAAVDRSVWGNRKPIDSAYLGTLDKVWNVKQPASGALAHRASDLIGKDVNSRNGEDIGDIKDLVVNMATQKVHYAVLAFDPSWTAPEQLYAFPLRAFNLTRDKDEVVLDIDKARLQKMKAFTERDFANLNERRWVTDIDRYFVTVLPVVVANPAAGGKASSSETESLDTLFTRLDDDKNGVLSKAEVKDSADVDKHWKRMDKDGNGTVSRAEFMANYTIEAKR
jgi:sporulation protein YlmC with PRC-barrel domain